MEHNEAVLLLGAMRAEAAILESKLDVKDEQLLGGTRFVTAETGRTMVILACAGVGKVNAAMTTTLALQAIRPRAVVLAGVAGGIDPDLVPGDIVLGQELGHHDYGMLDPAGFTAWQTRNPLNGEENPAFFEAAPAFVRAGLARAEGLVLEEVADGLRRPPDVRGGRIVTGDIAVADPEKRRDLYARLAAQACDMEGAAVAQVCHQHKVPWLVVRGITDTAEYTPPSFEAIARKVADQVAGFTVGLVGELPDLPPDPPVGTPGVTP